MSGVAGEAEDVDNIVVRDEQIRQNSITPLIEVPAKKPYLQYTYHLPYQEITEQKGF